MYSSVGRKPYRVNSGFPDALFCPFIDPLGIGFCAIIVAKEVIAMPTLQQRLEKIGYTAGQAADAVRKHAQMGKLFELERYISIKEHVLEVLG